MKFNQLLLKVDDIAPNFSFTDHSGNVKSLHELDGKKLVFFFPKAFTAGCTKQSCSLQENYVDLKTKGVSEVIGISLDNQETLAKFASRYNLQYQLISDRDGRISKDYGVYRRKLFWKFADRDTFIIGEDNKILEVLKNGLRGTKSRLGLKNHGREVMDSLDNLS